jgi:ubiquinone/menaquinone biosynthesis C-methylase UbiE
MRTLFLILAAFVAAAQTAHQHHPPASAEDYARVLEDPARDEWQKPHAVIEALALRPDEAVADIGAGSGYFARRFARHAGKVYAVDIDEGLLAMVRKDAPANLVTILAAPDDPKLPEKSVDTIFFCDVLHHIENRAAYLPKLLKALRPGGRVVDIDFYKKPLPLGPPEAMKLSEEQVIVEFQAAGFRLAKKLELLPYQYFLVFEPATGS